jgi:hypothetical protein
MLVGQHDVYCLILDYGERLGETVSESCDIQRMRIRVIKIILVTSQMRELIF